MNMAGLTAEDFLAAVQACIPKGLAWPRDREAVMTAFLAAMADLFGYAHGRTSDLSEFESFPASATQLLPDWEAAYGLPDECGPVPNLIEARRAALVSRITQRTSPTPATFKAMAEAYGAGVDVEVVEFHPYTCESPCEDPVFGEEWRFVWEVRGPAVVIWDYTVEDGVESPLRAWQEGPYACAIRRAAPAHTLVIFTYGA